MQTFISYDKHFLNTQAVRLAYLDFGGEGSPLLALHGHFSRGATFAPLAQALHEAWRVIALDQRGHGWSEAPGDYSREAYLTDLLTVIEYLDLAPVVLLGHSLGGVNAYQLAARRPDLVRALIIEDIGTLVDNDFEDLLRGWPERFPSFKALRAFLKERVGDDDFFYESAVEGPDGWRMLFNYEHMKRSQAALNGDWWEDWLASTCPALLLHGHKSWATTTKNVCAMAARRPNTRLVEFPECGHTVHDDDPEGTLRAVREFLASLPA